jgi:hypothetical protein
MMPIILNVALCCGVIVMVVAPLVWAVLTAHRDHPVETVARLERGVTPARRTGRQAPAPQFDATRRGHAWQAS